MGKAKARHCDECRFSQYQAQMGKKFVCLKGNKLRFYKPAEWDTCAMRCDWGWSDDARILNL